MEVASGMLALRVDAVETAYADAHTFLRTCGPALIRIDVDNQPGFLAIVRQRRGAAQILSPELTIEKLRLECIQAALCCPFEAPILPEVNRLLDEAAVRGRRRNSVLACILRERLSTIQIQAGWLLRVPAEGGLWQQAHDARLISRLAIFIAANTADYFLLIAAWWMIGQAALQGRVDYGLFIGWALLLLTRIPLGLLGTWTQGFLAIHGAGVLKRRLLAGSLRLHPEEVRHEGAGHLLGRVIESEALESLALSGGLTGIVAFVQLVITAAVLALGAEKPLLGLLLLGWTTVLCFFAWRYLQQRQRWTERRLQITNDLVECMAGHRTRLAQQPLEHWHDAEDEALERYVEASGRMDHSVIPLAVIVPRGWMILSLLALIPDFASGTVTPTSLAVAFGGILLAQGALKALTQTLTYLSAAAIAWRQAKPLFDAARREEVAGAPEFGLIRQHHTRERDENKIIMELRDVVFRHDGRADNALDSCNLRIFERDHILLEGASGAGKSTLASLLSGLREPHSGLIMLRGLDRRTLGSSVWRRIVAAAPQFHENHMFSATLAFNLLMGRSWPPRPEDYEEAESVCRELGLGDLLDRMPAGLLQTVGEAGWQLSYGERCRVFLARALLQGGDFIILDESFGALDPESVQQAMDCVQRRAQNLLVVAHP
jgi:ATP-binding cassette subfamily B protein